MKTETLQTRHRRRIRQQRTEREFAKELADMTGEQKNLHGDKTVFTERSNTNTGNRHKRIGKHRIHMLKKTNKNSPGIYSVIWDQCLLAARS